MKSRKAPIFPIALLIVCLGVAVAMKMRPADAEDHSHEPDEVVSEPMQAPPAKDLALKLKQQSGPKTPMESDDPAHSDEPKLLLKEYQLVKPTPSPTNTSAQWYKDRGGN